MKQARLKVQKLRTVDMPGRTRLGWFGVQPGLDQLKRALREHFTVPCKDHWIGDQIQKLRPEEMKVELCLLIRGGKLDLPGTFISQFSELGF